MQELLELYEISPELVSRKFPALKDLKDEWSWSGSVWSPGRRRKKKQVKGESKKRDWLNERTNERTNTWKNRCRTLVWCHHGGAIKWHTRVFQRVHPSRCIFVICFDTTCEELFGFILNVTLFTLSLFTYAKETASEASAKHTCPNQSSLASTVLSRICPRVQPSNKNTQEPPTPPLWVNPFPHLSIFRNSSCGIGSFNKTVSDSQWYGS